MDKAVAAVLDAGGEEEAVVARLGTMAIGELPCGIAVDMSRIAAPPLSLLPSSSAARTIQPLSPPSSVVASQPSAALLPTTAIVVAPSCAVAIFFLCPSATIATSLGDFFFLLHSSASAAFFLFSLSRLSQPWPHSRVAAVASRSNHAPSCLSKKGPLPLFPGRRTTPLVDPSPWHPW
ncbi:hypothetical protein B296_00020187 [Ensete ventricosum]|uniref:Uncharacterized protein n=1 Tax=Ensete ventricosum TaxID=4639 RepID=A0A426XQ19_ENSVE|nr:hypothetical protein B296_00020187 [Ensete ventricosum]